MTTITSKVIADSISPAGIRLTTLQLRYPRFIHAEFMTHRVFSRNAGSSRAMPVEKTIQEIIDDPAVPLHWGKNQKGMQAHEQHEERIFHSHGPAPTFSWFSNRDAWLRARDHAVSIASGFNEAGYHKQIVNRLLEPFAHINVVVTATEWSNFFSLRDHPDAEPHIQLLARAMKESMAGSTPFFREVGEWHLPYVSEEEIDELGWSKASRASVARCARVSYKPFDGEASIEKDLDLYEKLVGSRPLHASPAEHQAMPDQKIRKTNFSTILEDSGKEIIAQSTEWNEPHKQGNFRGWLQYRKFLPGENQ